MLGASANCTAAAVLDGWAYIDGGEFSITSNNDIDYNYSNQLIAIDLSQDWTNSTVVLNTIAKPNAPDLTDGGIWVDQDNHQLYIGFAGRRSFMGNNQPQQLGLWSFKPDGQGSGTWNNLSTTADPNFNNLQRQFSSQVTSGNGVGYSLGGFYINTSNPDPSAHQITASGLMMYDYSSKKRTNFTVTGTQLSTTGGGQLGGMVFTPNFGSKGILLAAGTLARALICVGFDIYLLTSTRQAAPNSMRLLARTTWSTSVQFQSLMSPARNGTINQRRVTSRRRGKNSA